MIKTMTEITGTALNSTREPGGTKTAITPI